MAKNIFQPDCTGVNVNHYGTKGDGINNDSSTLASTWRVLALLATTLLFLSSCCCPHTIVKNYPKASLPIPGVPGRLARVTDEVRGLWMDGGIQWFSLAGEWVNAKEFGAKGDGTTDDTAILQEALDAGNVLFPPGVYMVSPLSIPANRTLIGMGSGSVLKLKAGSPDISNTLSVRDASQVLIRDLAIDGNGNNVARGEPSHNLLMSSSTAFRPGSLARTDFIGTIPPPQPPALP